MVAAVFEMRSSARPVTPPISILAIKALADSQTLARVTGLLGQFGIIPAVLSSQRSGAYLLIDVQFTVQSDVRVDVVLAKIRSMVSVERADLVRC